MVEEDNGENVKSSREGIENECETTQSNDAIKVSDDKQNVKSEGKTSDSIFAMPELPVKENCNNKTKELNTERSTLKSSENNAKKHSKDKIQYFPLKEPPWGGISDDTDKKPYSLTILKDGTLKDGVKLSGKSRFTFGRMDDCDVVTEHPSCSRYHAVLQYCVEEKDIRAKGFYLYDMGSTHGTYLNKRKVKANIYNRVRVGYQMKFGGSSRLYILEGPEEDQEQEADVDIMREKMRLYEQQNITSKASTATVKKKKVNRSESKDELKRDDHKHEVTWGFGEDAQEEGINLKELFERKQNFEVKDPKKTLKGFFEREGLEFEYEMSEKWSGKSAVHVATIRLPLDTDEGDDVTAEGSSSNKKDAVLACATEACRLIQAYDCMRNKTREDQRLVKRRELEANDFYDSDEDSYLDRTGNIEKKRMQRKKRTGKNENEEVETHCSLKVKLQEKEKELSLNEKRLNRSQSAKNLGADCDSLDAFMSSMKDHLDKPTEMKLKRNLLELRREIEGLKMLVEKTKPSLPAFKVREATLCVPNIPIETGTKITDTIHVKPDSQRKTDFRQNQQTLDQTTESGVKKETKHSPPPKKKAKVYSTLSKPTTYETDSEFVGWTPPENQTGDGRTDLNDKLGY